MNFIVILVLVPSLVVSSSHHYPRPNFIQCRQSGVKCVSRNEFTYCSRRSKFNILEFDTLNCPEGYICQEGSRDPCIPDPEYVTTVSDDCNRASTPEQTNTQIDSEDDNYTITHLDVKTTTEGVLDNVAPNAIDDETDTNIELDTIHCIQEEQGYTYNEPGYSTVLV